MSAAEVAAFDARPGAADAVRLRRWDDLAKDPSRTAPALENYRELMLSVLRRG